tara:strand:+ start:165 stop:341 length:177 start_codon:yes stop_codon:yes gene_type:complete
MSEGAVASRFLPSYQSRSNMKVSECCKARLTNYDRNWDDGICSECNEHSPAQVEELVD